MGQSETSEAASEDELAALLLRVLAAFAGGIWIPYLVHASPAGQPRETCSGATDQLFVTEMFLVAHVLVRERRWVSLRRQRKAAELFGGKGLTCSLCIDHSLYTIYRRTDLV
jgi:hypothetical protein